MLNLTMVKFKVYRAFYKVLIQRILNCLVNFVYFCRIPWSRAWLVIHVQLRHTGWLEIYPAFSFAITINFFKSAWLIFRSAKIWFEGFIWIFFLNLALNLLNCKLLVFQIGLSSMVILILIRILRIIEIGFLFQIVFSFYLLSNFKRRAFLFLR